ncbi:hypothetical protein G7046_g6852 [Stylonectria norvegica]|nr:hypothetical protein G7046_g6852 [Stylonectria norvegica]
MPVQIRPPTEPTQLSPIPCQLFSSMASASGPSLLQEQPPGTVHETLWGPGCVRVGTTSAAVMSSTTWHRVVGFGGSASPSGVHQQVKVELPTPPSADAWNPNNATGPSSDLQKEKCSSPAPSVCSVRIASLVSLNPGLHRGQSAADSLTRHRGRGIPVRQPMLPT